MGFDCTLHAIDEESVQKTFVQKLLGNSYESTPFDSREDAAELWAEVRTALDTGVDGEGDAVGPEAVAHLVTQLALVFSAAEHPAHYERGFCLSLWGELPDGLAATVPKKHLGNPESLFRDLIKACPDLKGKFPREIQSNWCTGYFVPAKKVPELLTWVERKVKRYPKSDQRLFRGLLLILKHAADNELAYWEGTDLPVGDLIAVAPTESGPADVEKFAAPGNIHLDHIGGDGTILVFAHGIGFPQVCRTAFLDFATWPPTHTMIDEYALRVERSPGGKWVTVSMTSDEPYGYKIRAGTDIDKRKVLPPADKWKENINFAGFIGERVVAVVNHRGLGHEYEDFAPPVPLVEEKGTLVGAKGLPENPERYRAYGTGRLNDGTELFFWNGDGYTWRGKTFERTFPIEADFYPSESRIIPVEDSGFFYTSNRRLFSVFPGEEPVRHLKDLTNIMHLSPGPEGALLLREGDNKLGDLGKIYFPYERTYIRIEPELIPGEDPEYIRTLHWMPSCERLIVSTSERLWSVPFSKVLSLPRYDVETGKKLKEGTTHKHSREAFIPVPADEKPVIRQTQIKGMDFIMFLNKVGSTLYFSGSDYDDNSCVFTVEVGANTMTAKRLDLPLKATSKSRGGRWVVLGPEGKGRRTPPVCVGSDLSGPWNVLPPTDDTESIVSGVGFLGEQVVASVSPPAAQNPEGGIPHSYIMLEDKGTLITADNLEPLGARLRFQVVTLSDGSDVLVWGNAGYELHDRRLEKTFELDPPLGVSEGPIALGADELVYSGKEKNRSVLYRIQRGGKTASYPVKMNYISCLSPGPEGTVLLVDASAPYDQMGILYFLNDMTYIRIPADLFEGKANSSAAELHWDKTSNQLILLTSGNQVLSVSMKFVLDLSLYNAKTNRIMKN